MAKMLFPKVQKTATVKDPFEGLAEFKISLNMSREKELEASDIRQDALKAQQDLAKEVHDRREEARTYLKEKTGDDYRTDMTDQQLAEHYEPFRKWRLSKISLADHTVKLQQRLTACSIDSWSGRWPNIDGDEYVLDDTECTPDNVVRILFTDGEDEFLSVQRHCKGNELGVFDDVMDLELQLENDKITKKQFDREMKKLDAHIMFPFSEIPRFRRSTSTTLGIAMQTFIENEIQKLQQKVTGHLVFLAQGSRRSPSGKHSAGHARGSKTSTRSSRKSSKGKSTNARDVSADT